MMDINSVILWSVYIFMGLVIIASIMGVILLWRLRKRHQIIWRIIMPNGLIERYRKKGTVDRLVLDDKTYLYDSKCALDLKFLGIVFGKEITFYYNNPNPVNPFDSETILRLAKDEKKFSDEMNAIKKKGLEGIDEFKIKKSSFIPQIIKMWSAEKLHSMLNNTLVRDFLMSEDELRLIKILIIICCGLVCIGILILLFKNAPVVSCLDFNQTVSAMKQAIRPTASSIASGGFG
jgi:hypothetical protein